MNKMSFYFSFMKSIYSQNASSSFNVSLGKSIKKKIAKLQWLQIKTPATFCLLAKGNKR